MGEIRRLLRRWATALVVVALTAAGLSYAPTLGYHDRQSQIQEEKADLRQKIQSADRQAHTLADQVAASDARRRALEAEIASLNHQLAQAQDRLDKAEIDLAIARADLLTIERKLQETIKRHEKLEALAQSRIRNAYKRGPGEYLEVLLGATSFKDFVRRMKFVRVVMEDDRGQLTELEQVAAELDEARLEAVEKKEEIERNVEAIKAEKDRISRLKDQVAGTRQQVVAEQATRERLLSQVRAQKQEYLEAMARLEAESRSIAALLRNRQAGQVFAGTGKKLAWPVTGTITSGYGYRTDPIFSDRRFHTGIDIAARTGQPVIASEAGEVILTGVRSGYGLTIIIDHGNALATLYAHLSSLNVYEGQRVSRGAVIGGVGCTGWCTGPHLHFETRINGDPVDPMQFF